MPDTREWMNASTIGGNASRELKQSLLDLISTKGRHGYEPEITSRIVLTEISIVPKAEEPEKPEGRVVAEITVQDDMLSGGGTIHGACSAMLIDNCSSVPIALLKLATTGEGDLGVSQSLNILYHAPAVTNDRLRIIWNVTRHRLVASGVHAKMTASVSGAPSKL